ncbi:MAG: peptidoglycan DD-metalloendopeptidase family protein [candidate division Zixibacteria bacterium]
MKNVILSIIISIVIPAAAIADDPIDTDRLQNVKDELRQKRSEYDKLGEKEQSQLSRLRRLEEQTALSGQLLLKIDRAIRKLKRAIDNRQMELSDANTLADEKKRALYGRLKYVYKTGNRPGWTTVLLSRNPTEILTALKNMKAILNYDRHLAESYQELTRSISESIKRLKDDKKRLDILRRDYEDELTRGKTTLDTRKKLLDKLRKDKTVVSNAMDKLEEDTKDITGIFEDIEIGKNENIEKINFMGLEKKQGDLIWPVYGSIVRAFGTKKDKRGIKLSNPGIDIKAPYGSKVSVAAAGRVIYVSWLRGYGQFIIVDHGNSYYTLYANLGSVIVDVDDEVKAGQTIALVGDSGTLEGSRLHFELRRGKQQLNPAEWLR